MDLQQALVNAKLANPKEVTLQEEINSLIIKINKLTERDGPDSKEIKRLNKAKKFVEAKLKSIRGYRHKEFNHGV